MNILTVARRANLTWNMQVRYNEVTDQLKTAKAYYDAVNRTLAKEQLQFHRSTFLMGIVAFMEAYMADVAVEYLTCFPGHLNNKQFDLNSIVQAGSILHTIEALADKTINDLTYRDFPTVANEIAALFDKKSKIDPTLLDVLKEIKCTRDLYVHGNGKINSVYLRKAGAAARGKRLDEQLEVSDAYIEMSHTAILEFINEFYRIGPSKFSDYGRVKALQDMWNATCLAKIVSFENAWDVEIDDMVRPKTVEWLWSSSEQALYDFFLGIFNPEYPDRKTDALEALRKWPPPYREARVLMAWLESPFWF